MMMVNGCLVVFLDQLIGFLIVRTVVQEEAQKIELTWRMWVSRIDKRVRTGRRKDRKDRFAGLDPFRLCVLQ